MSGIWAAAPDLLALLDEARVRRNLAFMVERARSQGIAFRPHFKTHQSAEIGQWCREAGVGAITVSSVRMARYFVDVDAGWDDVTIAFPVNLRELGAINVLASRAHIGVLVFDLRTLQPQHRCQRLTFPVTPTADDQAVTEGSIGLGSGAADPSQSAGDEDDGLFHVGSP